MPIERKPLTGILPGGHGGDDDSFDIFSVQAADEFGPLPKGVYVCVAESGGPVVARTGTKGYEVVFRVAEGDNTGRKIWKTFYLTADAAKYSKRDLHKLGFNSMDQLKQSLPPNRFVCRLTVVLRKDDDGVEKNEVRNLELLRVEEPKADPFAPGGDAGSRADGDQDFAFGTNGEVQP